MATSQAGLSDAVRNAELAHRGADLPENAHFYAEQNARPVKNAEECYRSVFGGRVLSWNLRDRHMAERLQALVPHFDSPELRARVVVWEHNSHVGDEALRRGADGREGRLRRAIGSWNRKPSRSGRSDEQ